MPERLQKYLARAGVASRRKSEELIVDGKVEVDGKIVTELGTLVDSDTQLVKVDGQVVKLEKTVCILLHKPVSYVTTAHDPEGRRTVMDLVMDVNVRVYPVGRLDYETGGLLLLTNDGDLTYRLLHPKYHVDKRYRATVLGMPDAKALRQLQEGVHLEDGVTSPAQITVLRHHPKESVIEITIHEGRNRQIRRMFEAIDHPVKRLKRIQFGPLEMNGLASGKWRFLRHSEQAALYKAVGLTPPESETEDTARFASRGQERPHKSSSSSKFDRTTGRSQNQSGRRSPERGSDRLQRRSESRSTSTRGRTKH